MEQIMQEIKKAMAERGMTGYALAKVTGMSFAQVYRVLRGENTSVKVVQDICTGWEQEDICITCKD